MNEAAAVLADAAASPRWCRQRDPPAEAPTIADARWVAQPADHILAVMEKSRSTWQMWHVRAEAQRQIRIADVPADPRRLLVDLLVDEC